MHMLVIGATGQSGIDFCILALEKGHRLTLYVRNSAKIPVNIVNNQNATVIQGTLENIALLQRVTTCGATHFVSFAGPTTSSKGTPVTDAMQLLFPLLIANNFKRALVLGTCSYSSAQDQGGLKWRASVLLIQWIGGSAYDEFRGLGTFVASQDVSRLRWTLFRVPFLGNGAEAPVKATYTGSGEDGMFLSRKSMAAWVLQEMGDDSKWIGKTPVICN